MLFKNLYAIYAGRLISFQLRGNLNGDDHNISTRETISVNVMPRTFFNEAPKATRVMFRGSLMTSTEE